MVGAGYVGLASAAGLTRLGHEVTVLEVDAARVATFNAGRPLVHDEALSAALVEDVRAGRLMATTDPQAAIAGREVLFLCVGTPADPDGRTSLAGLERVCQEVAPITMPGALVVVKSTVPVGALEWLEEEFGAGKLPKPALVHNPEFLREGSALEDFLDPDRIVVGARTAGDAERLLALYRGIEAPTLTTDLRSAQLIKYGANCMLSVRISFMNMMAQLCEAAGADVRDVGVGVGLDRGVGPHYLSAGIGYGGPCLPKDLQALIWTGAEHGVNMGLLAECARINSEMVPRAVERLRTTLGTLEGKRIGLWGLTFKPGTSDMRDSPAVTMALALAEAGAAVTAFDPSGGEEGGTLPIRAAHDMWEAVDGQAALVVATDWPQFEPADLREVARRLATPVLLDGRRIYSPGAAAAAGLTYLGVGAGVAKAERELEPPRTGRGRLDWSGRRAR